ncbi:MAG: coiled-coil domain-containing protein [Promethearchaeota archaeon]
MFIKKTSKGIKSIFSSHDVETYLDQILELEHKLKQKDLEIKRYKMQISSMMGELKSTSKKLESKDKTIQEQRNKISDLSLQVEKLKDQNVNLLQQSSTELNDLRKKLEFLPSLDEYNAFKLKQEKLQKEVDELKIKLSNKEKQIHKLMEENLKIKERIKFLKERNI